MDTLALLPIAYGKLSIFILAFSRISALFTTFIFFRRDWINARIIIALTTVLSLYVIVLYPKIKLMDDMLSIPMLIDLFFEFLIGFITGFILNIIFEVFAALGQIISIQIGLSTVTLFDPKLGSITPMTFFYMYSAIAIFLALNGHLLVIKFIMDTFDIVPIGHMFLPVDTLASILKYSNVMFQASVVLSITIMITMLLTNLALAAMTRFAPQFNLFSIGINISIILGLICVYETFNFFVNNSTQFMDSGFVFLRDTLNGLRKYG